MANLSHPVFAGATIRELAELLDMPVVEVQRIAVRLGPTDFRGDTPVWPVSTIVAHIGREVDLETAVSMAMTADVKSLPAKLTREYWASRKLRMEYMRAAGDLWDTSAVVELVTKMFRTVRLTLNLMVDNMERDSSLEPQQRKAVEDLTRDMLDELQRVLHADLENTNGFTGKEFSREETGRPKGDAGGGENHQGLGSDDDEL